MRITPDMELCERRAKYLRDRNPLPLLRQRVQRLFTEAFHFQWRSDPGRNGFIPFFAFPNQVVFESTKPVVTTLRNLQVMQLNAGRFLEAGAGITTVINES
jgi:hypothetical protein